MRGINTLNASTKQQTAVCLYSKIYVQLEEFCLLECDAVWLM
jgi:hypothetical protein